jgi:hypothetical protein
MRRFLLFGAVVTGLLGVSLRLPPAASAALSNVSLVASNNQVSATGVAYTLTFQVGLAHSSLVVVAPPELAGLATGNVSVSTSADGATFSPATLAGLDPKLLSADGDRVAVNLASALAPGTWVKVVMTGITNPGSAGSGDFTVGGALAALTQSDLDGTLSALLTLLVETADATMTWVAEAANGVIQNVGVAPALTFGIGAASHSFSLDPFAGATSTATESLTIATNAGTYSIQAKVSGDLVRAGTDGSAASDVLPVNGAESGPHFAYKVAAPSGDTSGVDGSAYRTFSTSFTNLVGGWSLSGLTNGETTTITYDVKVDYTKAPGTYVGTVTYRIVPTY